MRVIFFISWFIIQLMFLGTSAVQNAAKWSILKHALLNILPPYEVSFMTNDIANAPHEFCEILYNIQENHATLIYDLRVIPSIKENASSIACKGNLFIVYHQQGNQFFSLLTTYMQYWDQICGRKPRPKILIILQQSNDNHFYYQPYFDLLWNEFYSDVTILNILNNYEIMMYQYNPFTSVYSKEILGSRTVLFPDKISDLSGKKLSVVFFDHPCSAFQKYKSGDRKLSTGLCAEIVKTLSKVMNFTIKVVLCKASASGAQYLPINMLNGTYDFCAYRARQTNFFPSMIEHSLEQSMFVETRTEYMIVPIKRKRLISYPINFVAFLAASLVLVFVANMWARIAKFQKKYWHPYNTWDCLLGISGRMPVTHTERTLFIAILILSVTHIGDLFQDCTTVNIVEIDIVKMDTFEDLDESGLIPGFSGRFFKHLHNINSKSIQNLVNKSSSGLLTQCYNKFILDGNVTCMVQPFVKDLLMDLYRRNDSLPLIKTLTDDSVTMHWLVFPQRKNSPYVNQFNKIIQRLIEHGLIAFWREQQLTKQIKTLKTRHLQFQKQKLVKLNDKMSKISGSVSLIYQILVIFVTGNILAIFAFLTEIIVKGISMRNAVIPFEV